MTEHTLGLRSPNSGGSILHNASDIHIHGGTFNAYGGSDTDKKRIEDIVDLGLRAEDGAPYDAAAREDVPKCHEHTRVAIIEGIDNWAYSEEWNAQPLMWMYGPAGSGKTTIVQTVAERFDKGRTLAASFFFSRLSASRPRGKENFVITIAHQLSLRIPAMKQLIDECKGDAAQQHILDLLERFLHEARNPVRILVASRTLHHIQVFFSQRSIAKITQTTPLDNHYESDEDIATFLTSKFEEIRDKHPAGSWLPSEWPPRSAINDLVERASGQFIYVSVIMTYISDNGRHPDESLQTIMSVKAGGNERPYNELDAFYAEILSTIEPQNVEFVRDIMGLLLLNKDRYCLVRTDVFSKVADFLFMARPGTTIARINRIRPLIVFKHTEGIHFAHASFSDYLLDQSRSKEFFLDMQKVHCSVARCWFRLFAQHFKLHQNGSIVPYNSQYVQLHPIAVQGQDWTVFFDIIQHCVRAEWTPELRQDMITFDFRTALKVGPESTSSHENNVRWEATVLWLDLTFWAERTGRLSSADAEQIRDCIKSMIQSIPSTLSTTPDVRRTIAVLLTWFGHFNIRDPWIEIEDDIDQGLQYMGLIAGFHPYRNVSIANRRDSSRLWFCKTMALDLTMNGSFFSDGNLYADLTLLMLKKSTIKNKYYWYLPIMLSKALPSEELATFLIHTLLQVPRDYLLFPPTSDGDCEIEQFFMAICIYLFECGITFLPDHQHRSEFDPTKWVCGICILVESSGVEYADTQLSQEPVIKPGSKRGKAVKEDVPQPLRVNALRQIIPGVMLLWLQTWIFRLADIMSRFVPVVA
ncbi:hypothetical protein D9619_009088 [Psilocybe cf. subviscida]|uniref:Nephrocystin 3-like N-terminal domain-containing protein n=1 Tax=Psilocybe cf. subviscida TaxID=2480587 RepID=A0A8H5BTW1_9AGAR|nr:hypothetical protein D9619_009088 [Psilocybe cf. subviscida]